MLLETSFHRDRSSLSLHLLRSRSAPGGRCTRPGQPGAVSIDFASTQKSHRPTDALLPVSPSLFSLYTSHQKRCVPFCRLARQEQREPGLHYVGFAALLAEWWCQIYGSQGHREREQVHGVESVLSGVL
jgi:hypothetical protein